MGTKIETECEACETTVTGEIDGKEGNFECDTCGAVFRTTTTQLTRPDFERPEYRETIIR